MKVKVRKAFRDIDTQKLMRVGDEVDFSSERAAKLARSGYVVLLEAQEEESVQETEPVGGEERDDNSEVLEQPGDQEEGEEEPVDYGAEHAKPEKEEIRNQEAEKHEFIPFPEKPEGKKRGRKPKQ